MRTPFLSPSRKLRPRSEPSPQSPGEAENLKGALLMIASMATFTSNDAAIKYVTQTLPLYEAVVLRGLGIMLLLWLISLRRGGLRLRLPRGDWGMLGLRTVGEVGSTVLYLLALRQMALGDLSAIMQSLPLAVTLGAALVFRESLGWRRMSAIAVGFAGVLLILRPGTGAFDVWALMALGAVLLIVVRDLATRKFSGAVPSLSIAFYAAISVTVFGVMMAPSEDWRVPTALEGVLIGVAALCLAVGYMTAVATMRVGEISFVAPFRYTSLVWAIVLGLFIFGEWPDLWTQAGAALIIGAGLYSIWREKRKGA